MALVDGIAKIFRALPGQIAEGERRAAGNSPGSRATVDGLVQSSSRGQAAARSVQQSFTEEQALSVLDRDFLVFDTARQVPDPSAEAELREVFADDRISRDDLETVANGSGFTAAQRGAARYLLDNEDALRRLDVAADDGGAGDADDIISRNDLEAVMDDEGLLPIETSELPPRPGTAAEGSIRVLNLNIGMGHGNEPWFAPGGEPASAGTDVGQMDDIADLVAASDADVVTLQEVFGPNDQHGNLDALVADLEAQTGDNWEVYFAPASDKIQWDDQVFFPEHAFDAPFGNAILVREGEGIVSSAPIGEPVKLDEPGDDGVEGRVLSGVTLHTADGRQLDVYTTHIANEGESEEAQQASQIDRVWDTVAPTEGPAIVTGDFNETLFTEEGTPFQASNSEGAAQALSRFTELGFVDAAAVGGAALPTSSEGHGSRIDYAFARDVTVEGAYVIDGSPSDHAGIVVDIQLPSGE